ncbi:hypothetical protein ACWEO1_22495 [Kitasatospora cineracea]
MSAPPPSDPLTALAVGLAEIRGELSTGLAEIKGELSLLRQSDAQTNQILVAHTAQLAEQDRQLAELRQGQAAAEEVRQADRRRLQAVAAVAGVLAAGATVVQFVRP